MQLKNNETNKRVYIIRITVFKGFCKKKQKNFKPVLNDWKLKRSFVTNHSINKSMIVFIINMLA